MLSFRVYTSNNHKYSLNDTYNDIIINFDDYRIDTTYAYLYVDNSYVSIIATSTIDNDSLLRMKQEKNIRPTSR